MSWRRSSARPDAPIVDVNMGDANLRRAAPEIRRARQREVDARPASRCRRGRTRSRATSTLAKRRRTSGLRSRTMNRRTEARSCYTFSTGRRYALADRQARREAGRVDAGGVDQAGHARVRVDQEVREALRRRMQFRANAAAAQSQILHRHRRQQRARRLEERLERQPVAFVVGGIVLVADRRPDPDGAGCRARQMHAQSVSRCDAARDRRARERGGARAARVPHTRRGTDRSRTDRRRPFATRRAAYRPAAFTTASASIDSRGVTTVSRESRTSIARNRRPNEQHDIQPADFGFERAHVRFGLQPAGRRETTGRGWRGRAAHAPG